MLGGEVAGDVGTDEDVEERYNGCGSDQRAHDPSSVPIPDRADIHGVPIPNFPLLRRFRGVGGEAEEDQTMWNGNTTPKYPDRSERNQRTRPMDALAFSGVILRMSPGTGSINPAMVQ